MATLIYDGERYLFPTTRANDLCDQLLGKLNHPEKNYGPWLMVQQGSDQRFLLIREGIPLTVEES